MIKAIETKYDGYNFRSRIEARWAVFFNEAGIKYEYEKEGYDLDGVWYLPDFWLPDLDVFIEIKGANPTEQDEKKINLLREKSDKRVLLMIQIPRGKDVFDYAYENYFDTFSIGYDAPYLFCECADCGKIGLEFDGRSDRMKCKQLKCNKSNHGDKNYNYDSPKLIKAYDIARAYRF